jgi:CDP-diacylglycerol---glycerol-3-phosphate 3-phosphatidyltransferase
VSCIQDEDRRHELTGQPFGNESLVGQRGKPAGRSPLLRVVYVEFFRLAYRVLPSTSTLLREPSMPYMKFDAVTHNDSQALKRLRLAWLKTAGWSLLIGSAAYLCLGAHWSRADALRWLGQTSVIWAYILRMLWNGLLCNHHPGQTALLPSLGTGTILTLCRGFLISALAGFFLVPEQQMVVAGACLAWLPGTLYLAAGTLDYLDGYVARRQDHVTQLGETLDIQLDGLGLLVAISVAIGWKRLPLVYLTVGAVYYLFRLGVWYRRHYGYPLMPMPFRPAARLMAGFQMGLVGIALLPLFSSVVLRTAALLFMVPLLLGFGLDWLAVCGQLDRGRQDRFQKLVQFLELDLPLVLRSVILGVVTMTSARNCLWELNSPRVVIWALLAMLLVGWMGRCAALLLSLALACFLSTDASSGALMTLFVSVTALMLSGTGRFSLWQPEEVFLTRRAG